MALARRASASEKAGHTVAIATTANRKAAVAARPPDMTDEEPEERPPASILAVETPAPPTFDPQAVPSTAIPNSVREVQEDLTTLMWNQMPTELQRRCRG